MILILSTPDDDHTGAVLRECAALGVEVALLDLSRFPCRDRMSLSFPGQGAPQFDWAGENGLDLGRCGAVWWRRPQPYGVDPVVADETARNFAYSECHEAVSGLWHSLDAFWVNDLLRDDAAHRKPFQLSVASRLGLRIPATLMTNDPAAAAEFCRAQPNGAVFKCFMATAAAWRETRLFRPEDAALLDCVRHAPVIFQEYVPGVDIRVAIVGGDMFAGAVDARSSAYPEDFRMVMDRLPMVPVALPAAVIADLRRLMTALGLEYGAVDLRRTAAGDHYFLEVNPAGQWLFVEEKTGQPISRAMAAHLAAGDRRRDEAPRRRPRPARPRVPFSRTARSPARAFP